MRILISVIALGALAVACSGDRAATAGSAVFAPDDVVLEVTAYGGCQMMDPDGCGPMETFVAADLPTVMLEEVAQVDAATLLAAKPGPCSAAVDGVSFTFTIHPPQGDLIVADTCEVDLAASSDPLAARLVEEYGRG